MRSGVTLFITLSIIAAMLALLGVVFKYLETARSEAEIKASLIQANVLYADARSAIRRLLGKTPKNSTYTTFYTTPLAIASQTGEFSAMIHCSPLADRPNIAWLGFDGDPNHQRHFDVAEKIYDALVNRANLRNPANLHRKITDALRQQKEMRFNILSNINKKKGTITLHEFQTILDAYRYESDDDKVYSIPWQTYFAFGNDMKKVDSNFIRPEVLALVFDIDLRLVQGQDGFEMGDSLKKFLEENGLDTSLYDWQWKPRKNSNDVIEVFAKKHPVDAMVCTVHYGFRDGQYAFRFDYINKKVVNFEFSGH
jgi:hypothetical protein